MRNVSLTRYQNLMATLIAGLIFILPSNLFYKLWEHTAYSQGLLIDYLIPKIYLNDILILAVFGVFCAKNCQRIKQFLTIQRLRNWLIPLALFSILIVRQLFTPHPIIAFWTIGKLTLFVFLAWIIAHTQSLFKHKHWMLIKYSLVLTILFQAFLAIFQTHYQQPLFGYLLLGEPNIAQPVGIAYSVDRLGQQRVLPYGTTAHPNILAAIAVIYFWIYWQINHKTRSHGYQRVFSLILVVSVLTILILAHSLAAWLGLTWVFLLHLSKKTQRRLILSLLLSLLIIPLLINFSAKLSPTNDSINRRSWLTTEAITMFSTQPLFGVGLTQFTTQLAPTGQSLNGPAFIQPAHHVLWLWIAETGIIGIALLISIYRQLNFSNRQAINQVFTLLLIFLSLDHFLLTQQAGLLLLVFVFTFAKNSISSENPRA